MKWFLIIILIFIIMLIATAVSEQYREKFDFYSSLKNFLQQFKLNVSFKQEKIVDFLGKNKPKKQFNIFVNAYHKYLKTNELSLEDIKILDNEEKRQLEEIVKSIGRYDALNEIKQIDTFLMQIEDKLKKAEQDKIKICPMIIKLSLLFAVGLAIILI